MPFDIAKKKKRKKPKLLIRNLFKIKYNKLCHY